MALLCRDLSDIPPDYLERAIERWVREKPFMPKANELAEMARSFMPSKGKVDQQAICDRGNAHLLEEGRHDIRWSIVDGRAKLDWN